MDSIVVLKTIVFIPLIESFSKKSFIFFIDKKNEPKKSRLNRTLLKISFVAAQTKSH